jgi:hypothetical protein
VSPRNIVVPSVVGVLGILFSMFLFDSSTCEGEFVTYETHSSAEPTPAVVYRYFVRTEVQACKDGDCSSQKTSSTLEKKTWVEVGEAEIMGSEGGGLVELKEGATSELVPPAWGLHYHPIGGGSGSSSSSEEIGMGLPEATPSYTRVLPTPEPTPMPKNQEVEATPVPAIPGYSTDPTPAQEESNPTPTSELILVNLGDVTPTPEPVLVAGVDEPTPEPEGEPLPTATPEPLVTTQGPVDLYVSAVSVPEPGYMWLITLLGLAFGVVLSKK